MTSGAGLCAPRIVSVAALVACATLASGLLVGCADEEPMLLRPMGLRPIPVDTKLPGELAEGSYVAFGLPLPREMRLTRRFPDKIYASGRLEFEHVSNYFRERLSAKQVETGPHRTIFVGAKVIDEPELTVDVDVRRRIGFVEIRIANKTRKRAKPEPELTEKERWGRMGLTPDGKVLEEYAQ